MDKKTNRIHIRCTEDEFYRIKINALKAKKSISDFMLNAALNKKIIIVEGVEMLIAEFSFLLKMNSNIIYQIKKIGTNINQIAHIANTDKTLNKESLNRLIELLEHIESKQSEYLKHSEIMTDLLLQITNKVKKQV